MSMTGVQTSAFQEHTDGQSVHQLQADLVSVARLCAMNEVSAAISHQTKEPLTTLLLYLHEMEEKDKQPSGTDALALGELVAKALHETKRVCDIIERVGYTFDVPGDVKAAVARGRAVIDSLTRTGNTNLNGHALPSGSLPGQRSLTPREHEVVDLIIGGASNKEGGRKLQISPRTFEAHRAHVMGKLGAKNAADLVRIALSDRA